MEAMAQCLCSALDTSARTQQWIAHCMRMELVPLNRCQESFRQMSCVVLSGGVINLNFIINDCCYLVAC